ncbi:hypothetical protein SDC9_109610 [bioreactor metagenome]|uniref:Uncharacterized protein n=1 Tax=bioreactor metagenome TaxID=1076179 RepID=A0A645BHR2_9ZZZZ
MPTVCAGRAGHGVVFAPHRSRIHHCIQRQRYRLRACAVGVVIVHPVLGQGQITAAIVCVGDRHRRAVCLLAAGVILLPAARNFFHRVTVLDTTGISRQPCELVLPVIVCGQGCRIAKVAAILFQLYCNAGRAGQVFHGVVTAPHLFYCQAGTALC